jgi:hypothetical protein
MTSLLTMELLTISVMTSRLMMELLTISVMTWMAQLELHPRRMQAQTQAAALQTLALGLRAHLAGLRLAGVHPAGLRTQVPVQVQTPMPVVTLLQVKV